MTETPARIRWTDSRNRPGDPAFTGSTGDLHSLFKIWPPEDPGDEWLLTSPLPGMEGERCYGFPDDLKAEAEHWLTRFAASLGAVFPEGDGWPGRSWAYSGRDRDGNLVLKHEESGGLYHVIPEEDL